MRTIECFFQFGIHGVGWQFLGESRSDTRNGLRIMFILGGNIHEREALQFIQEQFDQAGTSWLRNKGKVWCIDLDGIRQEFTDLVEDMEWLRGVKMVEPDIEHTQDRTFDQPRDETVVRFDVLKEDSRMTEPRTARIVNVMIASPGEASEERRAIPEVLNRWNAAHGDEYGVRLHPVMWETDAVLGLDERPQEMINKELIPKSDLLVAVFRSRIGTPTGKEISGTVEEIREFKKAGKHVLLYFYQGDVSLRNLDTKQLSLLTQFKQEMYKEGLVGDYSNIPELKEHLSYHLSSAVQKIVGPRDGGTERAGGMATEPRRKRGNKKATSGQSPNRKAASPPGTKGTGGVVDATGDLVLLGEEFFTTRRVKFNKDNTVAVEIPSNSAEIDAALGRYRPQQYSRPSPVPFAHGNHGQLVRVTEIESVSEGREQVWTLTLAPEGMSEGFGADMQYQTSGKTYTPEDFARMRAGRLLLNDPPPPAKHTGYNEDAMLEHFISGGDEIVSIKGCVVQKIFGRYRNQPTVALQCARLASVYYLLAGSIVEAILELTLGPVRAGRIHVRFRGRRRQRYANQPPATIQIERDCSVE